MGNYMQINAQKSKNQNKYTVGFLDIKNINILKLIFSTISQKKILEINKYNKKLQKRLGLNINAYIDYQKIIIEIIPSENKRGKFINIQNKKDESYYHIYFNDSKEEIKRYYLIEYDNVTKIKIIIDSQITSLSKLFEDCI